MLLFSTILLWHFILAFYFSIKRNAAIGWLCCNDGGGAPTFSSGLLAARYVCYGIRRLAICSSPGTWCWTVGYSVTLCIQGYNPVTLLILRVLLCNTPVGCESGIGRDLSAAYSQPLNLSEHFSGHRIANTPDRRHSSWATPANIDPTSQILREELPYLPQKIEHTKFWKAFSKN